MATDSNLASLEVQIQVNQRMVEAMASLERRYERLITRLREIVVIVNSDGVLLYMNPAWEKSLGYKNSESLGKTIFSFVAVESIENARERLAHKQSESGKESEVRFIRKNGSDMWVELLISDMPEENLLMGLMVDITARKLADDAVRESEERLSYAMDATGEGLWDWDSHSNLVRHNKQWCTLLGLEDDFLQHDLSVFVGIIHEDDRAAVMGRVQNCMEGHGPYYSEHRMVRTDGRVIWVEDRGNIVARDEAGNPLRLVGSFVDITARKQAQDALSLSERNLRRILSISPEGVLAFDQEDQISFCNEQLPDMLGISFGDEALAQAPQLVERFAKSVDLTRMPDLREIARGGAVEGTINLSKPTRIIKWEARELNNPLLKHILFFRDITRETEIDRMKSEFLATAAHELRTPMSSVYGFVELLLTRDIAEDERKEYLGIVYEQTQSLIRMLNELLDLARIEARAGKDFKFSMCDVLAIARKSLLELNILRDPRRVHIAIEETALPTVMVDEEKIKQVFTNIFSNAYKFSPNGGEIVLDRLMREDKTGKWLGMRVSDHGIGMTADQLRRIFERFYRADSSGSIPGTGLGMSLAKEIMQIHGGTVEVWSVYGKGTQVVLWFPLGVAELSADKGNEWNRPDRNRRELLPDRRGLLSNRRGTLSNRRCLLRDRRVIKPKPDAQNQ